MSKFSMKKSQYAMEFLIFFSIVAIMFIIWFMVFSDLNQETLAKREEKAVGDLGESIQNHLFLTANSPPGFYSKGLVIPEEAGSISIELKNTNYEFVIITERQEYSFSTPYFIGALKKGENTLWNVNGVVCIGDYTCFTDELGEVRFRKCSNYEDDDGDNLEGISDGGCWRDYDSPYYGAEIDAEVPEGVPGGDNVYNYYVICKDAFEEGKCSIVDTLGYPINSADCCNNTFEGFCC